MKITKSELKHLIKEELAAMAEAKYASAHQPRDAQHRQALLAKGYVEDPDQPGMLFLPHPNSASTAGAGDIKSEVTALEKALKQIKLKLGMS